MTIKDVLKKALRSIDRSNLQESFENVAQILMGKCAIQKGDRKYAIVEIEFYLYNKDHKDYITYPRDIIAGRWFFHQSGVDLTFESSGISIKKDETGKEVVTLGDNPRFGGILIRGLYRLNPEDESADRFIFGPQKCVAELWDDFNAFESSAKEYPIIVAHENNLNIVQCKRCINIKEAIRLQKIKGWAERLGIKELSDAKEYMKEMFENENTQLYRFFNLPDKDTFKKIPAASRPKKVRKIGGQLLPI